MTPLKHTAANEFIYRIIHVVIKIMLRDKIEVTVKRK